MGVDLTSRSSSRLVRHMVLLLLVLLGERSRPLLLLLLREGRRLRRRTGRRGRRRRGRASPASGLRSGGGLRARLRGRLLQEERRGRGGGVVLLRELLYRMWGPLWGVCPLLGIKAPHLLLLLLSIGLLLGISLFLLPPKLRRRGSGGK